MIDVKNRPSYIDNKRENFEAMKLNTILVSTLAKLLD